MALPFVLSTGLPLGSQWASLQVLNWPPQRASLWVPVPLGAQWDKYSQRASVGVSQRILSPKQDPLFLKGFRLSINVQPPYRIPEIHRGPVGSPWASLWALNGPPFGRSMSQTFPKGKFGFLSVNLSPE